VYLRIYKDSLHVLQGLQIKIERPRTQDLVSTATGGFAGRLDDAHIATSKEPTP
jgi:hypothetical protein